MSFNKIPAGINPPEDLYAVIEIPAHSSPIKYEIDKDADAVFVDRYMTAPMFYPADYGYIPKTLADDGDPLDVLVISPFPAMTGSVVRCRPIGMLNMTDESGRDEKVIAVPHDKLCKIYKDVKELEDLPPLLLAQIKHYFESYKTLEAGKWVKVEGWENAEATRAVIQQCVAAYVE